MPRGLESAHVDADFRDDHFGRERTDPGDGAQHFNGDAKGFDVCAHLLIDAQSLPTQDEPEGADGFQRKMSLKE